MDKIKRVNNNMNNNKNNNDLPRDIVMLGKIYSDFALKMDKSDFANSPRRYIVELNYVKNLKEKSIGYKLSLEAEKWAKKEEEIRSKLKEFGIKIDN